MMIRWQSADGMIHDLDLEFVPVPETNAITIQTRVPQNLSWEAKVYLDTLAAMVQDIIRRNSA